MFYNYEYRKPRLNNPTLYLCPHTVLHTMLIVPSGILSPHSILIGKIIMKRWSMRIGQSRVSNLRGNLGKVIHMKK